METMGKVSQQSLYLIGQEAGMEEKHLAPQTYPKWEECRVTDDRLMSSSLKFIGECLRKSGAAEVSTAVM